MRHFLITALMLFLASQIFPGSPGPGKRGFIGTPMGYHTPSVYTPDSTRTLIYFDSFDEENLGPVWIRSGNLEYYVVGRSLRVPVRTLKRSPKAGSITLNKPFAVAAQTVRFALDQSIPSRNPELSSAVFFCPPDAKFDADGLPDSYLRYYKRSQVELVEVKEKDESSKLMWARNQKVSGGEDRQLVFEIDAKNFSLSAGDSTVFSIKNPLPSLKNAMAGVWVSTKGVSESGGNVIFDNFLLETLRGEPAP
jgi:hypothetical protein